MTNMQAQPRKATLTALSSLMAAVVMASLSACVTTGEQGEETAAIFYPPLPQLPRLQFLTAINNEKDIGGGSSDFQTFLLGTPENTRQLVKPFDIDHEKGKLYVVDTNFRAVIVLNLVEHKFDIIKDAKGGPLQLPFSIFVDENGYKYVADKGRKQVVVFNDRDEFHRAFGAEGQFEPVDAVTHGNRVYVADLADHEVEILDKDTGEVIDKLGGKGAANGEFYYPTHLAFDSQGHLFVTDFLNNRVQEFDAEGNFVKFFGKLGDHPGAMPRPKGIALDDDGHLYTVDIAFELVQIFDEKTGDVLLGFGKFGPEAGGTWLPAGIDIDYDNIEFFSKYVHPNFRPKYLVYVANQAGPRKVNVYAFGEWIGPPPQGAQTAANQGS